MANHKIIISVKNISREYIHHKIGFLRLFHKKESKIVFRNISLDIEEGETVGITGSNGSGKTTFLKLLSSLYLPTNGKIFVEGYDTSRFNRLIKTKVSLNSNSERNFFWRLTGRQNLDFISSLNGIRHDVQYSKVIKELSSFLDMSDKLEYQVRNYSAGMREKLGYILTVLSCRKILIYDDFGKNLDEQTISKMWLKLKEKVKSGCCKAIILSSVKHTFLSRLVDKLFFIEKAGLKKIKG